MSPRALLLALALLASPSAAGAQTGGIQVAPVLVNMSAERNISSVRVRNGRDRPVSFEVDAFVWTQTNGRDVLTPTRDLLVAPGVFEVAANAEQVVRLGARASGETERAYRIVMRELPSDRHNGMALGFTLEMSLPVFVSPARARANVDAQPTATGLILSNTGAGYAQIALLDGGEYLNAPRYLLAGASAEIPLPAHANAIRLRAADSGGELSERTIHVGPGASLH